MNTEKTVTLHLPVSRIDSTTQNTSCTTCLLYHYISKNSSKQRSYPFFRGKRMQK